MPAAGRRGRCLMRSCIAILISDVMCVGPVVPDLPRESCSIHSSFSHASPGCSLAHECAPVVSLLRGKLQPPHNVFLLVFVKQLWPQFDA